MANFNKVILVGRLTRDPEQKVFGNGGKVAKFGFAVSDRKKNSATGQWEESPVFVDVSAFNRGENGKLADHVCEYLRKGSQALIEGKLVLDQWTAPTGEKRSKLCVVADIVQFLDSKPKGDVGGEQQEADNHSPEQERAGATADLPF